MLEHWMPYGTFEATNPVFHFGVRRLRWGRARSTLERRSRSVALAISAIVLALWLLVLIGEYVGNSCPNSTSYPYSCYYPLSNAGSSFASGLALLSIGWDILLDFVCLLAGYNTMRMGSEATHWDLLRMTPMHLETIVRAQHAVAQARSWLMTVVVTTLRFNVVALFLLTGIGLPIIFGRGLGDFIGPRFDLTSFLVLVALGIVGAVSVVEPLWRMRAVTALGVALAARFREATLGVIAALFVVLALWLLELFIMGLMLGMTLMIARVSWEIAPIFGACLGAFVIRGFYHSLTGRALGRGIRYATPR